MKLHDEMKPVRHSLLAVYRKVNKHSAHIIFGCFRPGHVWPKFDAAEMGFSPGRPKFDAAENVLYCEVICTLVSESTVSYGQLSV